MFDKIVKSVLNEITAQDAYNKYYNALPEKEFMEVVNKYGKYDNLMKLVMGSVMSGEATLQDANNFVEKYKSVDNVTRSEFLRRFKIGECETLEELNLVLSELIECGVTSEKQLSNDGLLIIYEDNNYLVTCTTTYSANHHYYGGKTEWCTASDRKGRYDGWLMFLRYTFDETMGYEYKEGRINFNYLQACLIQCTEKNTSKIYQFQVFKGGEIGLVCDEKDKSIYCDLDFMPLIDDLIKKNLQRCFDLTKDNLIVENEYMFKRDCFFEKKKQILQDRVNKKINELQPKVNEMNRKRGNFVSQKFNDLKKTNLLTDTNFFKETIEIFSDAFDDVENGNITKEYIQNLDEELKRIGYLCCVDVDNVRAKNHYFEVRLFKPKMVFGKKIIVDDETFEVKIKDQFSRFNEDFGVEINDFVLAVFDEDKNLVYSVYGDTFLGRLSCRRQYNDFGPERFDTISFKDSETEKIKNVLIDFDSCNSLTFESNFSNYDEDIWDYYDGKYFMHCKYPYYSDSKNCEAYVFNANPLSLIGCYKPINLSDDYDCLLVSSENGCFIYDANNIKDGDIINKLKYFEPKLRCNPNRIEGFVSYDGKLFGIYDKMNLIGDVYSFNNLQSPYYEGVTDISYRYDDYEDCGFISFRTQDNDMKVIKVKDL